MSETHLPRDHEGREIPLDTDVLYDEDGREFKVDRFTYSVTQLISDLKWGVVFDDCSVDYCCAFHLTPPESWERLEEDLDKAADDTFNECCAYFDMKDKCCSSCAARSSNSCSSAVMHNILGRIRKLRGGGEGDRREK